jgi:hypothetical protein
VRSDAEPMPWPFFCSAAAFILSIASIFAFALCAVTLTSLMMACRKAGIIAAPLDVQQQQRLWLSSVRLRSSQEWRQEYDGKQSWLIILNRSAVAGTATCCC